MIVDNIENAAVYAKLSEKIAKALYLLKGEDFADKQAGRYELDGNNIYYMVQRYQTKPIKQDRFESHKKYIDIQFVAGGVEILAYAPIDELQLDTAYDESGDFAFYKNTGEYSSVMLKSGMFCVLFSQDAHLPGRDLDSPSDVLKVVVKVRVD